MLLRRWQTLTRLSSRKSKTANLLCWLKRAKRKVLRIPHSLSRILFGCSPIYFYGLYNFIGQLDQTNNSISATKQQINQTSEEIKKLQVRLQNLNGSLVGFVESYIRSPNQILLHTFPQAKLENQAKEHQGALANVDAELFGVGEEIKKLEERERLRREQEAREAEARREQEAREAEARRQEQLRREQEAREAEAARQREAEARRQEQLRREQEERQRQINLAAADVFLGKQVSIKTSDGLFLKAMAGKYGNDIHVEKHRKEWETFTVQKLSEGVMAVKTHHGKFIRVRPGEGILLFNILHGHGLHFISISV